MKCLGFLLSCHHDLNSPSALQGKVENRRVHRGENIEIKLLMNANDALCLY